MMQMGIWTDVHPRFAAGIRTVKLRMSAWRSATALLGIFALLLQAMLFSEHRHTPPVSSRGAPTILAAVPATGHGAPAAVDNNCQICFALHHHSAIPVDFIAPPLPPHTALCTSALAAVVAPGALYLL